MIEFIDKEKRKKGEFRFVCNSRCLKVGDLICINIGKRKGIIGEVTSSQMKRDKYKVYFTYNGQDAKYPSISISKDEYNILKETGKCDSINIVRTRRGMIWRKYNRIKYESENVDQYNKIKK